MIQQTLLINENSLDSFGTQKVSILFYFLFICSTSIDYIKRQVFLWQAYHLFKKKKIYQYNHDILRPSKNS